MTIIIKAAKAGKRVLKKLVKGGSRKSVLSVTRRIERVKTGERICAMTFDDGPCSLPANPDNFGGKALTDVILDVLAEFSAHGTFDIVGDTGGNYPDVCGKDGTPAWGGVKFDHYPDFGRDEFGGAYNCPDQMLRIIEEGHELSNHGYAHRLFGRQKFVYNKRECFNGFGEVTADITRLHDFVSEKYGVSMSLSRPMHYVDRVDGTLNAYDVYTKTSYSYMAASFDGAGWLPSAAGYSEEVRLMSAPLAAALAHDPDSLCGQIIFQKDGYNMAHRSPVADGLRAQLELLTKYGYKVVTVGELLERCEVQDISADEPIYAAVKTCIAAEHPILFDDNTFRAEKPLTRGEGAMFLATREILCERVDRLAAGERGKIFTDMPLSHPYSTACAAAVKSGKIALKNGKFEAETPMSEGEQKAAFGCAGGRSAAVQALAARLVGDKK